LLCCIDSLISENFPMLDRVWNRPMMHCKPLIIDYVVYALGFFSCNARILHTSIWFKRNLIEYKHFKKHLLLNFIIDPNKLLYFPWYPDAFFRSVAFNLLAPFLKKWPLKKIFSGHFGPQVKFSGWNTGKSIVKVSLPPSLPLEMKLVMYSSIRNKGSLLCGAVKSTQRLPSRLLFFLSPLNIAH